MANKKHVPIKASSRCWGQTKSDLSHQVDTHAYDLTLDPDKLRPLLKYADQVARALAPLARDFTQDVAAMHALTPPTASDARG